MSTDTNNGARMCVLLVEDSPGDARFTQQAFHEANRSVDVHVAVDGVEAMAFLNREGAYADAPRPDLILLDLSLPRMDGREVLAHIKGDAGLRAIPTVILTASDAELDIARSYELRANAYLSKPVQLSAYEPSSVPPGPGTTRARGGSFQEQRSLALIAGQPGRPLELLPRFGMPAELGQEVAPNARQEVVRPQCRLGAQPVDELQAGRRPERHADRHGPVELHHRRRRQLGQRVVERGDPRPVGLLGGARPGVASRDRRLEGIRPERATERLRPGQGGEASPDQELVPAGAVLVEQEDRFAGRTEARPCA